MNGFCVCLRKCPMTKNISREALYELVWSKPMTHVAKDLGISDVMLGKMCKEQLVPKPPRGYWANLGSDKKMAIYDKTKLADLFKRRMISISGCWMTTNCVSRYAQISLTLMI